MAPDRPAPHGESPGGDPQPRMGQGGRRRGLLIAVAVAITVVVVAIYASGIGG